LCQFESLRGGPARTGEPGRLAPAHTVLPQMASPPGKLGGVVEIEMSGARIRVEPEWLDCSTHWPSAKQGSPLHSRLNPNARPALSISTTAKLARGDAICGSTVCAGARRPGSPVLAGPPSQAIRTGTKPGA